MKMKKETIKTIVIIGLIVVLLGLLVAFLIIPKYNNRIYGKGFADGQIDIIITQMQTGNIFIIVNETIQGYSLDVLCKGQNEKIDS